MQSPQQQQQTQIITNIFEQGIIQQDLELTMDTFDRIMSSRSSSSGTSNDTWDHKLQTYLRTLINQTIGGKCIAEGYVQPNSIEIMNVSSGEIVNYHIKYSVVFTCKICSPVEGMYIQCLAQSHTTGGIKASFYNQHNYTLDKSPMIIFIPKDVTKSQSVFDSVKEQEVFTAKIIGVYFELNDTYVSVLAKIIPTQTIQPSPSTSPILLTPTTLALTHPLPASLPTPSPILPALLPTPSPILPAPTLALSPILPASLPTLTHMMDEEEDISKVTTHSVEVAEEMDSGKSIIGSKRRYKCKPKPKVIDTLGSEGIDSGKKSSSKRTYKHKSKYGNGGGGEGIGGDEEVGEDDF